MEAERIAPPFRLPLFNYFRLTASHFSKNGKTSSFSPNVRIENKTSKIKDLISSLEAKNFSASAFCSTDEKTSDYQLPASPQIKLILVFCRFFNHFEGILFIVYIFISTPVHSDPEACFFYIDLSKYCAHYYIYFGVQKSRNDEIFPSFVEALHRIPFKSGALISKAGTRSFYQSCWPNFYFFLSKFRNCHFN